MVVVAVAAVVTIGVTSIWAGAATGAAAEGVGFSCGLSGKTVGMRHDTKIKFTYRTICAQDNLLVAGVFDFAVFNLGLAGPGGWLC